MSFSLSHGRQLDPGRVGMDEDDLPLWQEGTIDLRAWFGPEALYRPLELEIGSGKGTFLVQQAPETPRINYVGLEYARAFWLYASDRCRRHGIENVRLVRTEASFFLRNYVPDGCFDQVHIYFPDPWPKKRHHKRRLVAEPFLRLLGRTVQQGARVRLVTDHAGYFEWVEHHAALVGDLYDRLDFTTPGPTPGPAPGTSSAGEVVGTNFERKYRREGRLFHGLVLRRR